MNREQMIDQIDLLRHRIQSIETARKRADAIDQLLDKLGTARKRISLIQHLQGGIRAYFGGSLFTGSYKEINLTRSEAAELDMWLRDHARGLRHSADLIEERIASGA